MLLSIVIVIEVYLHYLYYWYLLPILQGLYVPDHKSIYVLSQLPMEWFRVRFVNGGPSKRWNLMSLEVRIQVNFGNLSGNSLGATEIYNKSEVGYAS